MTLRCKILNACAAALAMLVVGGAAWAQGFADL